MIHSHSSGVSWTIFLILNICALGINGDTENRVAPLFIEEPPDNVAFTNNSNFSLSCSAYGDPQPKISWIHKDGQPVETIVGLREVFPNGTLLFHSFRSENFRPDIHTVPYRCLASNSVGTIVSRLVHVRTVVLQHYAIEVHDVTALQGNAAVFQCNVPSFIREYVTVTSWMRDDNIIEPSNLHDNNKHTILPTGELFIKDVQLSDNGSWFRCQTVNRLNGESRTSNNSGRLVVTRAEGGTAPKIAFSKAEVTANEFDSVVIPCVAEGNPPPEVLWYARLPDGLLLPIHFGGRMKQLGAGLLIQEAQVTDSGAFVCDVKNGFGNARGETAAVILEPINVVIQPNNQTVDVGSSATFRCNVEGHPINSVKWLKNGEVVKTSGEELTLPSVKWSDAGIYQCFAENNQHSAQAIAQLRLGEISPEFQEVFQEENYNPGDNVSLRCSAIGSPIPKMTWYLDYKPLEEDRYELQEYVNTDGAIVSVLKINNSQTEDGGVYRCVATNKVTSIGHSARLNIYGPISIRPMEPISAVTGQNITVHCPVYGYPITSIKWWKDGELLPQNLRQNIYSNGTLVILDVRRGMDAGRYTCIASNSGESEEQDVTITVLVAPKIIPFSFQGGHLFDGVLARVSCVVFQGDLPLEITWTKDGQRISPDDGINISKFDDYSSILTIGSVTPKHTGNYTCDARNHASMSSHTAELIVNVSPRWKIKPQDTTVIVGEDAFLHCQAEGFPEPSIQWMWSHDINPGASKRKINRDDKYNLHSNGSLTISRTTDAQKGYYFCQAINDVGPSISAVAYLSVKFPAKLDIWQSNFTVHHGHRFTLECKATGDFPMNFTWTKGNLPLSSERYILKEIVINGGMMSELTVNDAKPEDSNLFGCSVENAFGRDSITFMVTIQEKPNSPSTITVNELGSRFANISWVPPFDGNSKIISYTVEYKKAKEFLPSPEFDIPENLWDTDAGKQIDDTADNFVVITNLQPASGYYLRLFANNDVGSSKPSPTFTILTKEEAPSGPPQDITVETLNSKTLKVCWKSYNDKGRGPAANEIMAMTAEGVPTESATDVACIPRSSQSIQVSWSPPHVDRLNGILQGFKVSVVPTNGSLGGNYSSVRNTTAQDIIVDGLEKFSNYSFRVIAFTRAGDGTPTDYVFCRTMEDVPGPPSLFRAMVMAPDAVLVTWKPSLQTNGIINQYTIHMKEEWQKTQGSMQWSVPNDVFQYDIPSLKENQRYSFWVTASTSAGEGERSKVVTLTPKGPNVPAVAISFDDDNVRGMWRQRVTLPCKTVGIPEPTKKWMFGGTEIKPNQKLKIFPDGTLLIKDAQGSDSGHYTCIIKNTLSKDKVKYIVRILAPPSPPKLSVNSTTKTSILLEWKPGPNNGAEIKGFTLKYRKFNDTWEEIELDPDTLDYELTDLQCGTGYEVCISAFNEIGKGEPSSMIKVGTNGSVPTLPLETSAGIVEGADSLTVHLDKAVNGDCPVEHYQVEYKVKYSDMWLVVKEGINSNQKTVVISGLLPATWYNLRLMAKTNAGTITTAVYEVATLALHGGTVNPSMETTVTEDGRSILFYIDLRIVIPIAACIGLLLLALIIMCVCVEKKKDITQQSPMRPATDELTPYATYHLNNCTELQTFQQRTSAPAGQTAATDTEDDTLERVKLHGIQQFPRPKSYTPESPSSGKKKLRQVAIPMAPVLPGLSPSRKDLQGSQSSIGTCAYQNDSLSSNKLPISRPGTPNSTTSTPGLKHKPQFLSSNISLPNPSSKDSTLSTFELPLPEASLPLPPNLLTDVSPVYSNVVDSKEFLPRS